MLKDFRLFFSIAALCFIVVSKAQPLVDTVTTSSGKFILHDDHTWSLLSDPNFNGVMNPRIHQHVSSLTPPFIQNWSNDVVFSNTHNDHMHLVDTIWLCLNEFAPSESSDFCFPMKKTVVTSRYGPRSGRYHNGIDLDLNVGDTIYAMFSGKIRYAKYNNGGFGNLVIMRHYNGLETFYAHLSKFLVSPNQEVKAGQPIALGGNTGRSTGPHLHMEVRFYEGAINPEEIIDFDHKVLKKENLFLHKAMFKPGAKPTQEVEALTADQVAYQSFNAASATSTSAVASPVVRPVIKAAQKKYHLIKSGETLTKIAARYGTTVSVLCKLNGITPKTTLSVGRNLRVK